VSQVLVWTLLIFSIPFLSLQYHSCCWVVAVKHAYLVKLYDRNRCKSCCHWHRDVTQKLVYNLPCIVHVTALVNFIGIPVGVARESATGKIINDYLEQKSELDDHVIHLLFSANRWEAVYVANIAHFCTLACIEKCICNYLIFIVNFISSSSSSSSSDRVDIHCVNLEWPWRRALDHSAWMLKGVPSPICWIHEWCGRPGRRRQPGPNREPVLAAVFFFHSILRWSIALSTMRCQSSRIVS